MTAGARSRPRREPSVVVVAALLSLAATVGDWVQKLPCRNVTNWAREGGVFNATHACYTDPVGLAQRYRLPTGSLPFRDYALEYPAGTGYVVAGLSKLATTVGGSPEQIIAHYWDATAAVLGVALFGILLVVGRLTSRPMVSMVVVAVGPLMLAELGLNWDLLALAPAVIAVAAWRSGRRSWAGAALGVGAAVKLFPLALLLAMWLAVRNPAGPRAGLRVCRRPAAWSLAVFALLQVPGYLAAGAFADDGNGRRVAGSAIGAFRASGLGGFFRALAPDRSGGVNGSLRFYLLNANRPADLDSTPHVVNTLLGHPALAGTGLTAFTAVAFITVVSAGLRLNVTRPGDDVALWLLVIVALLASNKVWSPQYSLWLLPFVVLAGIPAWQVLAWQTAEVGAWIARACYYQHLHDAGTGITAREYSCALVLRLSIVLTLTAVALRQRPTAGPTPRSPTLAGRAVRAVP